MTYTYIALAISYMALALGLIVFYMDPSLLWLVATLSIIGAIIFGIFGAIQLIKTIRLNKKVKKKYDND